MPGRRLTVAGRRQTIYREWTESSSQTQAPPIAVAVARRPRVGGRVLARLLMWSLPFLAGAAALFFWLGAGRYVETDNAYVKGDRVYVATELSGPIVEVAVRENQHVSRGQLLYRLDDTPYRLALAKIESDIEIQRAEIRGLRAQWRTKREDIKAALSQQVYAQADYERQKDLADRKFAPAAKLEESRMAAEVARQRIASPRRTCSASRRSSPAIPRSRSTTIPGSSRCWRRATRRCSTSAAPPSRRRWTASSPRCWCRAAIAVTGVPSVAVVADTDLWIEANFKETELTRVRVGQPVTITIDTYPDMKCTGKVTSLAQSTGAEFAVLPPQNATGNWVKVVQRIPRAHLGRTAARAIRRCGSA